jgi:predicted TPR repeat methyltransferase
VKSVETLYDELADKYDTDVVPRIFYRDRVRAFLKAFDEPGKRVLDVACGTAIATRELRDEVEVVGFDVSNGMLAQARAARRTGRFFRHDLHDPLPESEGRFDAAIAVGCGEFIRDLRRVAANVATALNRGGTLLLTTVHRFSAQPKPVESVLDKFDMHLYGAAEVASALEHAGLEPTAFAVDAGWQLRDRIVFYGYWQARAPE